MILHQGTLDRWQEDGLISEKMRRLLSALASGEPRTILELENEVYFDDPDGGPLCSEGCIRQLIFHSQKNLDGRISINPSRSYVLTLRD